MSLYPAIPLLSLKTGITMTLSKLSLFFFMPLTALFLLFSTAQAAEWKLEPGFSWRGTYDDNILFKDESDFENRFRPGMEVSRRTERSHIDLSGIVDIIRYIQNSEYDRENQDYRLSAGYAVSPRTSVSIAARAGLDYTFDEFWEEEGLVTDRSRRHTYNISPGVRLALDEQSSLQFNCAYRVVDFTRDLNPDYNVFSADLTWSRTIMDGRTDIFALTAFQRAEYDLYYSDSRQQVYRVMLGARRSLTETLDLSLRIGPMWTESRYDHPLYSIREDDLSYALQGSLDWRLEKSSLHLDVDRSETQSTYGENMLRERIRARMIHDLSPRWRASLRASFTQSRTDGYVNRRKSESLNLNSEMQYALTETMDLSLGYNHRRSKNRVTGTTDTGNRIFLMYSVSFPRVL